MVKMLKWNKKTASAFAVASALIMVMAIMLKPKEIMLAENTTLKPIIWTFQRPNTDVYIDKKLSASFIGGGGLSASMCVAIGIYHKNDSAYDGHDHLSMLMVANVTISNPDGWVDSVYIMVQKDQKSKVDWIETWLYFENLSLVTFADGYMRSTQAYIKLAGMNHAHIVYVEAPTELSLLTPNTESHQFEVAYEIFYYNGTAYNKLVQPFQLNLIGSG
jgi:hypothetical protein